MSDIFEALEICLRDIENGADVETILAVHPDFADELRPLLRAALAAKRRGATLPEPSPDAFYRGRAKTLRRAAQLREAKIVPRKRVIPIFQRLAVALTLAAVLLSSGTGLVRASSSALPGENLYPLKLTWENLRLFFAFDKQARETLEHSFRNERLREVNELLLEGRHETIQFAGIYMEVNGVTYVSGVQVVILEASILPLEPLRNGAAVLVTGRTNLKGTVDVETIELLPDGTFVPAGEPLEIEGEAETRDGVFNENGKGEQNQNETEEEDIRMDRNADENALANEEKPKEKEKKSLNDNAGKEKENDNDDDNSEESGDDDDDD